MSHRVRIQSWCDQVGPEPAASILMHPFVSAASATDAMAYVFKFINDKSLDAVRSHCIAGKSVGRSFRVHRKGTQAIHSEFTDAKPDCGWIARDNARKGFSGPQ